MVRIKQHKNTIGLVLPYLKSRGTERQALKLAKGFIEKGSCVVLFVVRHCQSRSLMASLSNWFPLSV
jgi:hypothetical protein